VSLAICRCVLTTRRGRCPPKVLAEGTARASPTHAFIVKRAHPGSLGFESVEDRDAHVGDGAAESAVAKPLEYNATLVEREDLTSALGVFERIRPDRGPCQGRARGSCPGSTWSSASTTR
jgi:hypothetical protein